MITEKRKWLFLLFLICPMLTNSVRARHRYLSPAGALSFRSSNLPIVIINTHNEFIPNDHRIFADMGIIYNGEDQRNRITDPLNHYNGKINIEIRGSSSTMFPKKQCAFETQDSMGNNLNVPLLGMPEENDRILYAPYSDKSLVRNVLTYNLAGDMGHYASGTKYCELVLNGDYRGVYVLLEKINILNCMMIFIPSSGGKDCGKIKNPGMRSIAGGENCAKIF